MVIKFFSLKNLVCNFIMIKFAASKLNQDKINHSKNPEQ